MINLKRLLIPVGGLLTVLSKAIASIYVTTDNFIYVTTDNFIYVTKGE